SAGGPLAAKGAEAGRPASQQQPFRHMPPLQSGVVGPHPLVNRGGPMGRKKGDLQLFGPEARRRAAEEAAARFTNQPLQDVVDYLLKYRTMTFVFVGDFDFRQKVTVDLNNQADADALAFLAKTLDCVVTPDGARVYRLSPK